MRKNYVEVLLSLGLLLPSAGALAADKEIVLDKGKSVDMAISIYNNSLGFVRDTREVMLEKGKNSVAFVGVADQIKPETAMLSGDGIVVREQNYNYNLLTPYNILNESVGKTVKTALYNEQTGQTTFSSAKIIDSNNGRPVLQFDYGIETDFPGRIVYEKLPENLTAEPTLNVTLNNKTAGSKKLELAYLTTGISWKADYVAEVDGRDTLSLNGWITLDNQSGTAYENAAVQLIAGSVNEIPAPAAPRMYGMVMKAAVNDMAVAESTAGASREALGDYYLYTLPFRTTVKDKQSKQVSLFARDKVRFVREYKLVSPLYAGLNMRGSEFERANPQVMFKLNNVEAEGLGLPMPGGTVRFYENDSKGNMQFIGESSFRQLAKGEKTELLLGKSFDVSAKGKIANVTKLAKDSWEGDFEVSFKNAKSESATVNFEQNFGGNWTIVSESLKSDKKNASTALWKVEVPANGEKVLTFKARITAL